MPATAAYKNTSGHYYPLTKMNFVVSATNVSGMAAFTEVTGIDSSVDVIEFRQGNAWSMAPVKLPGLVKHGNITLKYGVTMDSNFKQWVIDCVNERRGPIPRDTLTIQLIDTIKGTPQQIQETTASDSLTWTFTEAWVCKYTGPDLNSTTSEVAMETVEIAYEEVTIANPTSGA